MTNDPLTIEERQRVERVRKWDMLGEDVAQLVKLVDRLCQRLAVDWLPAGSVPQTAGSYLFTEHGKVWAVYVQDEDFEFNRFETDRMKSVRWASWEPPALPPLDARPTA